MKCSSRGKKRSRIGLARSVCDSCLPPIPAQHIIDLQLAKLEKLLADRKLTFELTPAAREILATEGYDPAFGARPLKRAIQRLLQNPLALAVLEGKFNEGDHIVVDRDPKGELTFRTAKEPALARK